MNKSKTLLATLIAALALTASSRLAAEASLRK